MLSLHAYINITIVVLITPVIFLVHFLLLDMRTFPFSNYSVTEILVEDNPANSLGNKNDWQVFANKLLSMTNVYDYCEQNIDLQVC